MRVVCFRCDGGPRVGAGHVARCLQIALAFRGGGDEVAFAGRFEGVAAQLLAEAEVEARPEVAEKADLVVVDSYDIPAAEVEVLAADLPVVTISDGGPAPRGAIVLDYHPDAPEAPLAGTDYAPVSPRCVAARRPRGFERALVTVGGGESGDALRDAARAALHARGLEVLEPAGSSGLHAELARADVAVSAAGVTAYELACAGVPAALVPIAGNQDRVARSFAERGISLAGDDPGALTEHLADERVRAALAAAGPAAVDGYGAFRTRDGIVAAVSGDPPPPVLRYRPAGPQDRRRQLAWRNDQEVRASSWQTHEVSPTEHAVWFERVLADPKRTLLVIESAAGAAGSVRFDAENGEAEISVMVAPGLRGFGIGRRAIRESCELYLAAHPETRAIRAEIREDNPRSGTAFAHAGFVPAGVGPEGRPAFTLDRAALASGAA